MKNLILTTAIIFVLSVFGINAQTSKLHDYMKQIGEGRISDVKKAIPDLLAEDPDNPGVQLLHALVLDDPGKALEKYKNIVKNYPESEWADQAFWRIVQYYAVTGETEKAKIELEKYRKLFPNSELLIVASEAVRTATNFARNEVKAPKEPVAKETKATANEIAKKKTNVIITDSKKTVPEKVEKKEFAANNNENTGEKWGLQVGIYSTKEAAESELKKFKQQRLLADILRKEVDGGTMYAVVIGDYSSRQSAETGKTIVQQQCKCSPILYKK